MYGFFNGLLKKISHWDFSKSPPKNRHSSGNILMETPRIYKVAGEFQDELNINHFDTQINLAHMDSAWVHVDEPQLHTPVR